MRDSFGREIDYLRISLTERCNLRCLYCMPDWNCKELNRENRNESREEITLEEIRELVQLFASLGIKKVRLTGGEPLLRKDILEIVNEISKTQGIEEVTLTTNGILLENMIENLEKAGIKRVNISLDTLDEYEYRKITRGGDIEKVLRAIEKCLNLGIKVKINCVITNFQNLNSLEKLLELTIKSDIDLRFIEMMPIGYGKEYRGIDGKTLLHHITEIYELKNLNLLEGTSRYYQIDGAMGRVGFINPMSQCFCGSCNKIRITSDMKLKPCLSSENRIDLREILASELSFCEKKNIIEKIIYNRDEKNIFNKKDSEKKNMNEIGG